MKNYLFIFALIISTQAFSETYKCTDANGKKVYSQFPCSSENVSVLEIKDSDKKHESERKRLENLRIDEADRKFEQNRRIARINHLKSLTGSERTAAEIEILELEHQERKQKEFEKKEIEYLEDRFNAKRR